MITRGRRCWREVRFYPWQLKRGFTVIIDTGWVRSHDLVPRRFITPMPSTPLFVSWYSRVDVTVIWTHPFCYVLLISERELTFAICCRPSVRLCRLSVTLVHPTQAVVIFGIFLRRLVPWPSVDIHWKFYGDRPRGTPPSGELNPRVVAKYSDFGPIDGYLGNGAR